MAHDPLLTALLDLDVALASRELIIGGGYGLYLKQLYLKRNPPIRTLFPPSKLPSARTTEDIDLILRLGEFASRVTMIVRKYAAHLTKKHATLKMLTSALRRRRRCVKQELVR
jgi:hypothetical protein